MKAVFTTKWELIIVAENATESLALKAWSDRYFPEKNSTEENDETEKSYLLIQNYVENNEMGVSINRHKEWCIGGDKSPCNCGAE